MFPEQVTLFPEGDSRSIASALDCLYGRVQAGNIQPPTAALELISAKRMSVRYQKCYDRLCGDSGASRSFQSLAIAGD